MVQVRTEVKDFCAVHNMIADNLASDENGKAFS
jgi:hypothetical protein